MTTAIKAIRGIRGMILILGFASLTVFGQKAPDTKADTKASIPAKPDPYVELVKNWNSLQQQVTQYETTIKDQALQLQNVHIQMREAKLQMKELESKIQASICDKGKKLVAKEDRTFTCVDLEGKPK